MRNLLLTIEYDGTGFSGWQRQPGKRTVQGELERVLSILCAQQITIDGTCRTDAGVHALGQCATFSGDFGIPTDRLMTAANDLLAKNRMMGGDVRITSVREVPPGFHARFSAKGKQYIYRICCAPGMPVFLRNYMYHVKTPLNVEAMRRALRAFEGTHDFAGFMAAGSNLRGGTVRTIYKADLIVHPGAGGCRMPKVLGRLHEEDSDETAAALSETAALPEIKPVRTVKRASARLSETAVLPEIKPVRTVKRVSARLSETAVLSEIKSMPNKTVFSTEARELSREQAVPGKAGVSLCQSGFFRGRASEKNAEIWEKCKVQEEHDMWTDCEIEISLRGDGFLYNMVRIIAGTLVDVGTGKLRAEDMPEIIDSCDRSRAGHTAPPQGLYMAEVYFQENLYEEQSDRTTGLG